ncbi:MAG TPA: hypothetical protein VD867_14455 [Burkholderiales bacterium]|nr:hypothetical protein [Burkholderiales bacterium]
MKSESYISVLRGLRGINMNQRDRARAEAGVLASATIIELLAGMAGMVGLRAKNSQPA